MSKLRRLQFFKIRFHGFKLLKPRLANGIFGGSRGFASPPLGMEYAVDEY